MPNTSSRRGRGRRANNNLSRRVTTIRNELRGASPRGTSDPPRVIINPWNTMVLQVVVVGTSTATNVCITPVNVHAAWQTQHTSGTLAVAYRIQRMSIWHLIPNGELNNHVRARFYSLFSVNPCDNSSVLSTQSDFGTPARLSHIHYVWPRAHQEAVLIYTSTTTIARISLEPTQQVVYHLHLLWRFTGGTTTIMDNRGNCTRDEMSELLHSDLVTDFDQISISDDFQREI